MQRPGAVLIGKSPLDGAPTGQLEPLPPAFHPGCSLAALMGMSPDPRQAPTRSLDLTLLRRTAERIVGDALPAERAAVSPEVEEFMTRHGRCAVLQTEGPASAVIGSRISAECLDCGESLDWWKAPAGVTTLVGLN